MTSTGVAAINIDGTIINTALAIPKETGDNLPAMSDQKKTQMRMSLADLKVIIIDNIPMVANTTLLHIRNVLILLCRPHKEFSLISFAASGNSFSANFSI